MSNGGVADQRAELLRTVSDAHRQPTVAAAPRARLLSGGDARVANRLPRRRESWATLSRPRASYACASQAGTRRRLDVGQRRCPASLTGGDAVMRRRSGSQSTVAVRAGIVLWAAHEGQTKTRCA